MTFFQGRETLLLRSIPVVDLWPNTPQKAAGIRTDPPISLPIPNTDAPEPTAAPSPPELPPGECTLQGLFVLPYTELYDSNHIPHSGILVPPTGMAAASRSRATTVASRTPRRCRRPALPNVSGIPPTSIISLTVNVCRAAAAWARTKRTLAPPLLPPVVPNRTATQLYSSAWD